MLKSFSDYEDFRKKSHRARVRIDNIIKRNVKEEADEIYGLETTVVTVDLSRLRRGKMIKDGFF